MSDKTNAPEPAYMSGREWLDNQQPAEGKLFVELRWDGESEIFYSQEFESMTIAQAGERAVAGYLSEADVFPDRVPMATVYWADGRGFDPFAIEISISIEAVGLRGGE